MSHPAVADHADRNAAIVPDFVADAGTVRLGGTFRLPPAIMPVTMPANPLSPMPVQVPDTGRIRLGGTFRLMA